MNRRIAFVLLVAIFACCTSATFASDKPGTPKGAAVTYPTIDKKTVAGMSWGSATAPVVILLADDGAGRASLDRLVEPMLARRLAVVALDARAGSADDVAAAVHVLRGSAKARTGRMVGIFGVGAGASTALEAAKQLPDDVVALLCLAPKASDPAIESGKGLRTDLPVLVVARTADAVDARKLHVAILGSRQGAADLSRLRIVENPPALEGDKPIAVAAGAGALGTAPLLEAYVAGFFARELAAIPNEVLLDGDVTIEAAQGGAWTKATMLPTTEAGGQAWAVRFDRRIVFGGWMPKGITLLHLKLRASAKALDWKAVTGSPIAPAGIPHQFLDYVVEAPVNKLRIWNHQIKNGRMPDMPSMPGMPPDMPPFPGGPTNFEDPPSPYALTFAPRDGGWSFEGEVRVENVEKVKNPRIEMAWGWLSAMPGMPRISMRPWMEWDMTGPWTELTSR